MCLGGFTKPEDASFKTALDAAYSDVRDAFRAYVATQNKGRPFFIASHSQGSMLSPRLLAEEIAGTVLQASMVGAYLVGLSVPLQQITRVGLHESTGPEDVGAVCGWDTAPEDSEGHRCSLVVGLFCP
jgi:hypothetical protein